MTKQQWEREKIVELYIKALKDIKFSEEVWKDVAKANKLILDGEL